MWLALLHAAPLSVVDLRRTVANEAPSYLPKDLGTGMYGQLRLAGYWQDAHFSGMVREKHVWEPHVTASLGLFLSPGSTYVDAGGNIGVHALLGGKLVGPTGSVHTFEAHPQNARALRHSVRLNGMTSHVHVHNVALGAARGSICMARANIDAACNNQTYGRSNCHKAHMEFQVQRPTPGSTSACGAHQHEVPMKTLDEYHRNGRLSRVDVIKVDIEGSEVSFLNGALATIRATQPIILFEMKDDNLRAQGATAAELVALLQSLSYRIFVLGYQYPSDHIAVPESRVAELRQRFGPGAFSSPIEESSVNPPLKGVTEKLCLPTTEIVHLQPLNQAIHCKVHPAYLVRRGRAG